MKRIHLLCFLVGFSLLGNAQLAFNSPPSAQTISATKEKHRSKPVQYNSLGYNVIIDPKNNDIIIGGTSVSYKRWGLALTYKLGVRNLMLPEGDRGEATYDNVVHNKWTITGNIQRASVFMAGGVIVIPITKRLPFYFGAGTNYSREFFEYVDPFEKSRKWNVNPNHSDFEMNYSGGVIIPVIGRFLLNLQYDHNPQSVFVGIVIRNRFCYEDIDEW